MVDFLIQISQRPLVIALAIFGALLVTAGSLVAKPRTGSQSDRNSGGLSERRSGRPSGRPSGRRAGSSERGGAGQNIQQTGEEPRYDKDGRLIEPPDDAQTIFARRLTQAGYGITMISVVLFIIAGFVSDLRP